jgi:hypothetical protein
MAYCNASDVREIIHTTLTDTEIDSVIEMSDALIIRRIGSQGSIDKVIKKLSVLITARTIKTRQPLSMAAGEYREDSGNVLEVWGDEIERIYRLYRSAQFKASEYGHIDEDQRYPEES